MEIAYTAGVSTEQFYQSTLYEVFISIKGYGLRINELWKMTRFQSYLIYCTVTDSDKRADIFSFLPLNGDPINTENEVSEDELMALYQKGLNAFK